MINITMTLFDRYSEAAVFLNGNLWAFMLTIMVLLLHSIYRFSRFYLTAQAQFRGPPLKNFLVGKLDQTMGDYAHLKML